MTCKTTAPIEMHFVDELATPNRVVKYEYDNRANTQLFHRGDARRLDTYIREMHAEFPNFIFGFAAIYPNHAQMLRVGGSNAVVAVNNRGALCAMNPVTNESVEVQRDVNMSAVFYGRLPIDITNRSALIDSVRNRMINEEISADLNRFFLRKDGRVYVLAPVMIGWTVGRLMPNVPSVLLDANWWRILDIEIDHTYCNYKTHRHLCLFNPGRDKIGVADTIKQRCVPRFLFETMIADIVACVGYGELRTWMLSVGTDFHKLYNLIGKPNAADDQASLWAFYKKAKEKYAQQRR